MTNDFTEIGSCAHLAGLKRTRQGPFNIHNALLDHQWTLDDITSSIAKHKGSINKYYRYYQHTSRKDSW